MRELKFRYWNGARMIQQKDIRLIDFNNNFVHYFDIDTQEYNQEAYCDRFPLMQYTGLKDIDGKEIYEGDIIKHFDPNHKGVIKFGGYGYGKELFDIGYYINWFNEPYLRKDLGYWLLKGIKVIGNVFENLDLLEVEK